MIMKKRLPFIRYPLNVSPILTVLNIKSKLKKIVNKSCIKKYTLYWAIWLTLIKFANPFLRVLNYLNLSFFLFFKFETHIYIAWRKFTAWKLIKKAYSLLGLDVTRFFILILRKLKLKFILISLRSLFSVENYFR